ncbi:hypothetical protein [Vibrio parahaemolyticus]|uniref:hypothetical protein n=1 Tax=Vibrio parahaemolyticus TaxID=670 RepID=UPI00128F73E2|nr:hypothetical protein [Vibrio parahaemolyticus]MQF34523.1 hypothetical protein [Vibrio parahaemolyticus]
MSNSKEIKNYDEMRKQQIRGVLSRKEVIEDILKDINCDSFKSFTALTNAVAKEYTKREGQAMNGSTLRRTDSKYRSLVDSYYRTEERVSTQSQDRETQLQEELLITQLELSKTLSELKSTRAALQNANTQMDKLRLSNLNSRIDESVQPKYSDEEVAAYKALVELARACEGSGIDIDGHSITTIDFDGSKILISQEKCPSFFKWYREQIKRRSI